MAGIPLSRGADAAGDLRQAGAVRRAWSVDAAVPAGRRAREALRQLGVLLHDQPAAISLWDLTAFYGVATDARAWTPRPDDYIVPASRS